MLLVTTEALNYMPLLSIHIAQHRTVPATHPPFVSKLLLDPQQKRRKNTAFLLITSQASDIVQ